MVTLEINSIHLMQKMFIDDNTGNELNSQPLPKALQNH